MRLWQMLKRDGRLWLRGVIPALLLAALLAVACGFAGMSALEGAHRDQAPVRVALVDEEDSVLSRISISMVTGQDYVSSLLQLEQTDEFSAQKGLANGRYAAAVILPDGYMDSIMHGRDCTGKILLSDALQQEGETIRAIADFGARLLCAGQYGVFAGEQMLAEGRVPAADYDSFLEDSNTGLIRFALGAYDSVFTFEVLPYSDTGVSLLSYYLACWVTLILFVCGLFFPDLYTADCRGSLFARLRTLGIGRLCFMPGKILYPLLFRAILCLPAWFLLGGRCYAFLLAACLVTSLITGNIAVALAQKGGWAVSILGCSAAMLFLSGGCLPRTMLPELLPRIAAWSPFGAVQSLLIAALGGTVDRRGVILCFVYAALCILWCMRALARLDTHREEVRL